MKSTTLLNIVKHPCSNKQRMANIAVLSFLINCLTVWSSPIALAQGSNTLGFVIWEWYTAAYNSKFADECPEGLATPNDEYWWRSLSKSDRSRLTDNGRRQASLRQNPSLYRGPDGELVCVNPTVLKEPPPPIVEGPYSYGANLDGNVDGGATAKTCAHENFTSLDSSPGIDNQMYRLVGCTYGWRNGGPTERIAHEQRTSFALGTILIEITGVTDPRNSDEVTVTFYRASTPYTLDGQGLPLPFSSYHINASNGQPLYNDSLRGSIEDGVLTTERGDVRLPFYGHFVFLSSVVRDLGLRLEIAPDGTTAKGVITGYYNVTDFLRYTGGMLGHTTAGDNCPSMYDMAHQLADGYPDPKTGQCTMLSSAFDITTYAAFAIHPENETTPLEKTAQRQQE